MIVVTSLIDSIFYSAPLTPLTLFQLRTALHTLSLHVLGPPPNPNCIVAQDIDNMTLLRRLRELLLLDAARVHGGMSLAKHFTPLQRRVNKKESGVVAVSLPRIHVHE